MTFCVQNKNVTTNVRHSTVESQEYVDVGFSMISQSTVGVAFMRGRLESVPLFGRVLCYSHQRIKSCLAQLMLLPCRHGAQ